MYSLKVLCLCGNVAFRIGRISRNRSVLFWLTTEKEELLYLFFVFVLLLKVSNTILSGGLLQSRSDCSLIKTFMTIWKKARLPFSEQFLSICITCQPKDNFTKKRSVQQRTACFQKGSYPGYCVATWRETHPVFVTIQNRLRLQTYTSWTLHQASPLRFLVFPILQLPGMVVPLHRTLTDAFLIKHRPLAMISNFREVPMFKIEFANWIGFFEENCQAFLLICRKNGNHIFLYIFSW